MLRLAIPLDPATLDPAKAADLPSLNVVHELNAGLTRFSGRGVEPDLAESWEPSENGLVWTFHLRKGLRWSNDVPITAEDFRRSWLRALAPETRSAYARAEMQNIRGARRYRVTGSGEVGVEAVDDRTLRVTLQHPVPWLDEQVAWPVFFPVPRSGNATSGPFRLASRTKGRLVLERNFNYWNVAAVKPRRVVLTTLGGSRDGILPQRPDWRPAFRGSRRRSRCRRGRRLPTLSLGLLWLVTEGNATRRPLLRELRLGCGASSSRRASQSFVPRAMPGYSSIVPRRRSSYASLWRPGAPADPGLHERGCPRAPARRRAPGRVALDGVGLICRRRRRFGCPTAPRWAACAARDRPGAARLELRVLRRVQHPRPLSMRQARSTSRSGAIAATTG